MEPQAQSIGRADAATRHGAKGWELPVAGVVLGMLSLAIPVFLLQLFDRAIPTGQFFNIAALGFAVLAAIAIFGFVDGAVHRMADHTIRQGERHHLQSEYRRLLAGDGDIVDEKFLLFENVAPTASARPLIAAFGLFAVQIIGIAVLTGAMAVLPAVLSGFAIGFGYFFAGTGPASEGDRTGTVREPLAARLVAAVWTIKFMGAERLALRHARSQNASRAKTSLTTAMYTATSITAAIAIERVTLISTVLAGTVLAVNGLITGGQLIAGAWLAVVVVRTGHTLGTGLRNRQQLDGTDMPETAFDPDPTGDLPPLPMVTGNILLNNLSYAAPGEFGQASTRQHFDRVRCSIDAGEMVQVTSGNRRRAGACLRLIAGLETPDQGQLLIDGHDLTEFRADTVRRQIAYVPPNVDVFPGTVMENLTAFDPSRSVDAMGAARLVGLDRTVSRLGNAYDTVLTPEASGFPIGFRQHLGLARALALKPKILLLDFATENLDSRDFRTFSEILARLKGRVTIVFAATQMGLQNLADREVNLDELKAGEGLGTSNTDADDTSDDTESGITSNGNPSSQGDA